MFDFDVPDDLSYRESRHPKKSDPGEYRIIHEPNPTLKEVQERILAFLYKIRRLKPPDNVHGFVPGRNTMSNAMAHDLEADLVLGMDVSKFFDTLPVDVVRAELLRAKLSPALVDKILVTCTLDGHFPQGAPTSPYLTSIGMLGVDRRIRSFAERNGFTYTRYADDITLSITFRKHRQRRRRFFAFMFTGVDKILSGIGLRLNPRKSRYAYKLHSRIARRITGITLGEQTLSYNAPKRTRREYRAGLHNLEMELRHSRRIPDDAFARWSRVKGFIRYSDYIRSWSPDPEHAVPDVKFRNEAIEYVESRLERR